MNRKPKPKPRTPKQTARLLAEVITAVAPIYAKDGRRVAGIVLPKAREAAERILRNASDPIACRAAAEIVQSAIDASTKDLMADASRYQWLRRFDHFAAADALLDTTRFDTLDAAVDHLMSQP